MAVSFTPEQQKVIDTHGCNLLVSAAAGSGKTAVLVERIIQMIANDKQPVDIDRLLVVTFTNAAASQMRERISLAISKRLEQEPDNAHLQRQAALIHNAQITTIDSFCLFVIRNNFNEIALDPGFRVVDEGELNLLKQEVLQELLEECYADKENNSDFLYMVEYFSTGNQDKNIEEYILKLYQFAISNPWPLEWLQERKGDYKITDVTKLDECLWVQEGCRYIGKLLATCVERVEQCIRICEQPDGPYMYGELLEAEQQMLEKVSRLSTFTELYEAWETIHFDRLPGKKDDSVSGFKRTLIQNIRKDIKGVIADIGESYFTFSPEMIVKKMEKANRAVEALIDVACAFLTHLEERKRKENMIDFSDMEHLALQVLLKKTEHGYEPTEAARDYRKHFYEILIDEYQDSNLVQELLLRSISGEEEGNHNRFMVGDVKQSIYKFRLARPEILMEKLNSYSIEESECQRIDLHKNFRSRREILEGINFLFGQIMSTDLGGVAYDEDAMLNPGAVFADDEADSTESASEHAVECLFLTKAETDDDELSAKGKEALLIATRIKELVGSFLVQDDETGVMRCAKYSDIVILLRSNAGWDEEFRKVFEKEQIPTYIASRTGYFQTREVQVVLQLLRVLDNPMQDIPLFGVLKSYFADFTEEEVAFLHACSQKRYATLWEQLQEFLLSEETAGNQALQSKVQDFLHFVEKYRQKTTYTPIHELLQELLIESGYLQYVTALPAGGQRRANIEMLLTRAAGFEQTSYYGLFHFVRYMEQLEKYEVDYGEANILDEQADVVRLMSIHKSKGLEFPICFAAGMAKRFNMQDGNGRLIADIDLGIGVDYVDFEQRVQSKTLRKNVIAQKMRQDNIGEELRVLYVAMTRAKEKLIITGVIPEAEKVLLSVALQQQCSETILPFATRCSARSYLDFLLPALCRHVAFEEAFGEQEGNNVLLPDSPDISIILKSMDDIAASQLQEAITQIGERQRLELAETDAMQLQQLKQKFERTYPFSYLEKLYTKTTVSELKKAASEELYEKTFAKPLYEPEEVIPYIPSFIEESKMSGTARGSAYHRVMELLKWEKLAILAQNEWKEEIEREITDDIESGQISQEYGNAVQINKIMQFMETTLAERMRCAAKEGKLYREQPFVLGLPASRLNAEFPDTETILIQGIIDVYFEEAGQLIVVDYKTDAVNEAKELVKRYKTQLDYYEEALQQLTGKMVQEKIIYSFALNQEICLE